MDADDRDAEYQSVGDAHMIKLIPQEDMSVANGTIMSISLNDGKVIQNIFTLMKICTYIHLQCTEEGFSFIGLYTNKQSKMQKTMSEQRKDMVFYLTFKKDRIPEYFFCPNNLNIDMPGGKKTLTFVLSMNQITTMLKKTKIKATTSLRFDLNGKTGAFAMYIVDGISVIPYTLTWHLDYPIKDVIPEKITNPKLTPNYKISVELFYKMINAAASKSDNVAYDFRIAIHKGGVAAQTDAPGVGAIPYGTMGENPDVFNLFHDSTKYFGLLHKITPRSTILLTSVDNTIFKVTFPIGSAGEGFIFQFPKQDASTILEQHQIQSQIGYTTGWGQQSQIGYTPGWQQQTSINTPNGQVQVGYGTGSTWQQQQSSTQTTGWQQQYSGYSNQQSLPVNNSQNIIPNVNSVGILSQNESSSDQSLYTSQVSQQPGWGSTNIQQTQISSSQQWQPTSQSSAPSWGTATTFDTSQYTNVYNSSNI